MIVRAAGFGKLVRGAGTGVEVVANFGTACWLAAGLAFSGGGSGPMSVPC